MSDDALLTDLYELTMLQAYLHHGMHETGVFELFVRKLPPGRSFLVAAGLEQVVTFLRELRFDARDLAHLRSTRRFGEETLAWLAAFRFRGDVDALPEGTVFFENEPILRVSAPIPEAQLVEPRIINLLQYQVLIASKAARCVLVAPGRRLVEFGMRRAHGAEAALTCARATFLAGFSGSSNVEAEARWGIPAVGTMAHSFVQAHDDEAAAFERFARANPEATTLLVDTYDTLEGVRRAIEVAHRLERDGVAIRGVRLDSGDLLALSRATRRLLDEAGLHDTRIFASGGLDEHDLRRLVREGAPIDGFGIGTRLDTSADAPYLDAAFKLVAYAGRPRMKRSTGKVTLPAAKQVWRRRDAQGRFVGDTITLLEERAEGEPLLVPVLRGGELVRPLPDLEAARRRCAEQLAALPPPLRELDAPPTPYPVRVSERLGALAERLAHDLVGA